METQTPPPASKLSQVIKDAKQSAEASRENVQRAISQQLEKSEKATHQIRNLTPKRLSIYHQHGEHKHLILVLAPLESRNLILQSEEEISHYDTLKRSGDIAFEAMSNKHKSHLEDLGSVMFTLLFFYAIFAFKISSDYPDWRIYVWGLIPALAVIALGIFVSKTKWGWVTVLRVMQQLLTFFLVLATGSGLVFATIYYFGDGKVLLTASPDLHLLGRSFQFVFITVASLLPALLYFLFDRNRLGTLRTHFEQQIFRFDPNVKTLTDVHSKYGSQLDELFGRDSSTAKGRHKPGTRWPIWVCTLVITLGWIFALQPVGVVQADAGLISFLTWIVTQQPISVVQNDVTLVNYLTPHWSNVVFGFLGAYYFAVFSVSRRYTRGDLQPKAYSHILVRIIIVFILAWVVDMLVEPSEYTYGTLFLIGVVPETFWTVFNEFLRNQVLGSVIHSLKEKDPLTNLEGIDPYDRARLEEEGVTNVESLAHHDLIDLILATRIPLPRLVDWLDQAILYLHLPDSLHFNVAKQSAVHDNHTVDHIIKKNGNISPRKHLKAYGIRTATDLLYTYDKARERGELEKFLNILEATPDRNTPARLQLIYDTLQDDEWLSNIMHWRNDISLEESQVLLKDPA